MRPGSACARLRAGQRAGICPVPAARDEPLTDSETQRGEVPPFRPPTEPAAHDASPAGSSPRVSQRSPWHSPLPRSERQASADTACVYRTFGLSSTYQPCVRDEQILLNDLWSIHVDGPNQQLTTDGYSGNNTANDVAHFNDWWLGFFPDWITPPVTWHWLCVLTGGNGFEGACWHAAGCPLVDY